MEQEKRQEEAERDNGTREQTTRGGKKQGEERIKKIN
jgi:hypothetical protein